MFARKNYHLQRTFYKWKKYYYEVKHKRIAATHRLKRFSSQFLLQKYFQLIKWNILEILKYHKISNRIKLNRLSILWTKWIIALQNSNQAKKRKYLVAMLMNGNERRSNYYSMRRAYQFWRVKFRLSGVSTKRNSQLVLFRSMQNWKHLILARKHFNYILQLKSFKGWKDRVYHVSHTRDYIKNRQKYITRILQFFKRKYCEIIQRSFQHWSMLYGPEFERRKQRPILDTGVN